MKNVKNYIDKLVDEKNLPYIDVCAYQKGKNIFRYFNGKNKTTGKELLYMFSMTKPITVVALMQLVEKGLVNINDKVCKYLPKYQNLSFNNNGIITKTSKDMTIENLLTMTSGMNYNTTESMKKYFSKYYDTATTIDVVNSFVDSPLSFDVGQKFNYSLSLDVVGAIIEVVTNKSFSEFLTENIFIPLDMKDTTFVDDKNKIFDIYLVAEDGKIEKTEKKNQLIFTKKYQSGGAGIISTVDDYMKFANMLLNSGKNEKGKQIVSEKSIDIISTDRVNNINVDMAFTCVQGNDYGYGYGVRVRNKDTSWGLNKGEFGWDGAAGSYLMVDKNKNISIVIGMHLKNWPYIMTGEHLNIVKEIYQNIDK